MQKKSIIIIICLIVVIIAIVLLAIYIMKGRSLDTNDVIKSNISMTEPKVEFSIEPSEQTEGTVTIYVNATIAGDSKIKSITLPNGQVITSAGAKYEVSKNGEYEFIVKSNKDISVTKTVTIDNIDEVSADNPYIPSGFTHVSDTEVDTGYVIEDSRGNQFVWVPVPTGSLVRNTDGNDQYEEIDSTATGLYNSVSKYYGFYIARYEASKMEIEGEVVAASEYGVIPWSNVKYDEAYRASQNAATIYGYKGVKTAMASSYAWDTTINWINESFPNYSSNTSYGNYSGTILKTGTTEMDDVNSICDLAGNLREWTTEVYYPEVLENVTNEENDDETEVEEPETYRVIRGGSANINRVANSHSGNPETMSDVYWGFRMILYKD